MAIPTMYAAALGRDLALCVDENHGTYTVYATDGDGNHLFDVAATVSLPMVYAMLPIWSAQAIERMETWSLGTADNAADGVAADWTSWPKASDNPDDTAGPIPDGSLLVMIGPQ